MKDTDDRDLPAVTDEAFEQALPTSPFTIVILKAGPKHDAPGPDRAPKTIRAHAKRNFVLRSARFLPIVCPVSDGSGVTGVSIFDAGPEDVDRIMSRDPAVIADILTFDVHPIRTFPGSALPN